MANIFEKLLNPSQKLNAREEKKLIKEATEQLSREDDEAVKAANAKKDEERHKKNALDISFLTKNSTESKSEYANFINNNFSNTKNNINGRAFIEKLRAMLFNSKQKSMTLAIDKARTLVIELDDSTKKLSVGYKDNASGRIFSLFDKKTENYLALEQKLNKFYMEVNPESAVVKNYEFKKWDTTYQGVTDITKKREIINNIYNDLLDTGFFAEVQARTLAKAMLLDYDINCFANPLYTVGQMEQIILTYGDVKTAAEAKYPTNTSSKETNEKNERIVIQIMSKIENRYRDMNQFCAMNFKYKFCDLEFSEIKKASEKGKLSELAQDPNLPAKFKLLYAINEAAINGIPKKINIGNDVFVVESYFVHDKNKTPLGVNTKLTKETEDLDGTVRRAPVYTEVFGKKPAGSLEPFYKAYKETYDISDSMKLLEIYMQEVTNGIKDNTNDNDSMEVELSNGDKLLIKGISYYTENIHNEYDMTEQNVDFGVQIYYKNPSKTELVYSDKPKDRTIYTNLSTLLRKCGGIIPNERIKRQSLTEVGEMSVADEILSQKPSEKESKYLPPEEMYDKYYQMGLDTGSAVVELPNNDSIRFKRDVYLKDGKVHKYCIVQYKKEDGEYKNIYSISSGKDKNIINGSKENVLKLYKAAIYGGDLDKVLSDISKNKPQVIVQGKTNNISR